MPESTFPLVWFRYSPNTWANFELLAWQDQGVLTVRSGELEFRGGKYAFVIRDITGVSRGMQGRDFINSWLRVDYLEAGAPRVAYFVDGSMAGWGGILGGTKRIHEAITRSVQSAGAPTAR